MINYKYVMLWALLIACHKPGNNDFVIRYEWKKIVVPGEQLVISFYGDIYDRMIVGTNLNIVKTTDKGNSWQTVAANVDQVAEFIKENDTLFAVSLGVDHFSLNDGDSWIKLPYARVPRVLAVQEVKTSTNRVYKLELGTDGELATPTKVLTADPGSSNWKNIFPYKHYMVRLYADAKNKIYVGGSAAPWTGVGFTGRNPEDGLIFYLDK